MNNLDFLLATGSVVGRAEALLEILRQCEAKGTPVPEAIKLSLRKAIQEWHRLATGENQGTIQ